MFVPSWSPDRPFNDLPPLPASEDLETRPVLRALIEARASLAALNQGVERIPNPSMLINTVPVLEALASSAIENIVTTEDDLFRNLQAEDVSDPATKEALNYRRALMNGYRTLAERPISTRTAESICSTIRGVEMGVRRVPGTRLAHATTGEIIYTPPEGESNIRDLLADWEHFIHRREDLDPLTRMAAAHYQFEAIHPFTDGNGRTGRILNSLLLIQEGLLSLPILYLSRHIIRHREDYYRLLIEVTRSGAWEPWLLYMLEGVRETSHWTLSTILEICELVEKTATHLRDAMPKIYSRELVEVLFSQPYCRIGNLVNAGIAKRQTASRYLKALAGIGVIEERVAGREKLFINSRLMELLRERAES